MIKEINWNPVAQVIADDAVGLLPRVMFTWSDELLPLVSRDALFSTVTVNMTPNAPASPIVGLRGTVAVDGNLLIWSVLDADLSVISPTIFKLGSFVRFDVDCNQFMGPSKKPISSSTAPLYGGDGPFVPGGILRVAMVITPQGAPVTFMRRPFVGTPAIPVLPGVNLEPQVIG